MVDKKTFVTVTLAFMVSAYVWEKYVRQQLGV